MKKNISRILIIAIILIILTINVNALLINVELDKDQIKLNEIAKLKIRVYNDGEYDISDLIVFIKGEEDLTFLETNMSEFRKSLGKINKNETKEIDLLFKLNSDKKNNSNILIYYNQETQVIGTKINIIKDEITINQTTNFKKIEEKDRIVTKIVIKNDSNYQIFQVRAEIKNIPNYTILNNQMFFEEIGPMQTKEHEFIIIPPIGIQGEEEIIINYGYFDKDKKPRFFEEKEKINYGIDQKNNLLMIGIVLVAIGLIAYFLKYHKN
jgi:hypothetical protein